MNSTDLGGALSKSGRAFCSDDLKDPYQLNNLPLEENKEILE